MKILRHFPLFLLTIFVVTQNVSAAKEVEVLIRQKIEPVKVLGLIISPTGTVEKKDVQLRKSADGLIVSIPITEKDGGDDAFVSAMALTSEGEAFFADLRPLSLAGVDKSFLSLPMCEKKITDEEVAHTISVGNPGMIITLMDIRSQRREILQKILKASLEGAFLEKLRAYEKGLGLETGDPLSADLNPYELTDRLNRILLAIKNARVTR